VYAAAERRSPERCLDVYGRMLAAGLRPDGYTLVAALRGATWARQGLAAAEWALREAARHSVPLSPQLANGLLGCLRDGPPGEAPRRLELALDVLCALRGGVPSAGRASAPGGAAATRSRLPEGDGGSVPPDALCKAYASTMLAALGAGRPELALALFRELQEGSQLPVPSATCWGVALEAARQAGGGRELEEQHASWLLLHGD
jgi:hypothetical protein